MVFFNQQSAALKNCFDVMHINCRSLNANFSSLLNLLTTTKIKPSVIAVSETWLNSNNQDIFQIDGFQFVSKSRMGLKTGGGVGLYISNAINIVAHDDLSVSDDIIECIFAEISYGPSNGRCNRSLVGCIYRPPGGDVTKFTDNLSNILSCVNKGKYNISILAGDFNVDLVLPPRTL